MRFKELDLLPHLFFNVVHRARHFFLGRDVVRRRVDGHMLHHALGHAGNGVDLGNPVDFVAEKLDADGAPCPVGGVNFERVSPDAEGISREVHVVALVADIRQAAHELVPLARLAGAQADDHVFIVDWVAQTVDARDRAYDDHVPALGKRGGRRVAQALDFVVDGGVLFNIRVRVRDVRLGLIVVIVGDEVFDGVFREKLAELRTELRGKRFVVREHERRAVQLRNDVCHRERFA